jgi:hypothetical protein
LQVLAHKWNIDWIQTAISHKCENSSCSTFSVFCAPAGLARAVFPDLHKGMKSVRQRRVCANIILCREGQNCVQKMNHTAVKGLAFWYLLTKTWTSLAPPPAPPACPAPLLH